MSKSIYLDPGHGGGDPGASKGSRYEKNDVLRLCLRVRELLTTRGITVIMSRATDVHVPLIDRVNAANKAKVDYYLSVHRNAGGGTGTEAWVYDKANAETQRKARIILDAVVGAVGLHNRGLKFGAPGDYRNYWVNSGTTMSASLLEISFVDNDGDNANFDARFETIAVAITRAICEVLGVSYEIAQPEVTPSPAPSQPTQTALKVGDKVTVKNALLHYNSAGAKPGKTVSGDYIITLVAKSGSHIYNIGKKSGEYLGWIAASAIVGNSAPRVYRVGEMVSFRGGNHYAESNGTKAVGGTRKSGTAKITAINLGGKHPYHLVGVTSNVHGWTDTDLII